MSKTTPKAGKTEELRETLAVILAKQEARYLFDYWIDIKHEYLHKADQILKAIKDMDMAFVVKETEYPEADPHSYEGEFEAICATQEAFIKADWHKTEKID